MDDKNKQEIYSIRWQQSYDLSAVVETMENIVLAASDYAEAKELIARVKAKL